MKRSIETRKPAFSIEAVVVTPLTQIDPTNSKDPRSKEQSTRASIIKTKTSLRFNADTNRFEEVPFFSANAIRSMCRAEITKDLHAHFNRNREEKGKEPFGFETGDFFAYTSGGGSDADTITPELTYAVEARMRELSPFFSLFGIGLGGIEGKTAFTRLAPTTGSFKIDSAYGARLDRTKGGQTAALIDAESVAEWSEEQAKARTDNKAYRAAEAKVEVLKNAIVSAAKNKEDHSKLDLELVEAKAKLEELEKGDASYQQLYKYQYIAPGTVLHACVDSKAGYRFTDVEKGMLLKALVGVASRQIGAMKASGHGVLDWKVLDDRGEAILTVTSNRDYLLERTVEISEHGMELLGHYEKWLEAQTEKSYRVNSIYEEASASAKMKKKTVKADLLA